MHTPAGFQPVCSGSSGDVQTVHIICILASPTRLTMTERQQDVVCVVFEIVLFLIHRYTAKSSNRSPTTIYNHTTTTITPINLSLLILSCGKDCLHCCTLHGMPNHVLRLSHRPFSFPPCQSATVCVRVQVCVRVRVRVCVCVCVCVCVFLCVCLF